MYVLGRYVFIFSLWIPWIPCSCQQNDTRCVHVLSHVIFIFFRLFFSPERMIIYIKINYSNSSRNRYPRASVARTNTSVSV